MKYDEARDAIREKLTDDYLSAWIGLDYAARNEFADIIICEEKSVDDAVSAFISYFHS